MRRFNRNMNRLIEEGQELNDKISSGLLLINTITMISEGQELQRQHHHEYSMSEKEFTDVVSDEIAKKTRGFENIPLHQALMNMYYVGLSIGYRIGKQESE